LLEVSLVLQLFLLEVLFSFTFIFVRGIEISLLLALVLPLFLLEVSLVLQLFLLEVLFSFTDIFVRGIV
jgi:hypothetical protein